MFTDYNIGNNIIRFVKTNNKSIGVQSNFFQKMYHQKINNVLCKIMRKQK